MSKRLKRKSDEKGFIKKTIEIIKKTNEQEKFKSQERKAKKDKKPKGYTIRKLGVYVFWFVFILMFLIVVVNSGGKNKGLDADNLNLNDTNKASSAESIEFTKNFLSEYFTWNVDTFDRKERIEKMGYFVTTDLMKQIEDIASDKWHSSLRRESILLKNVEDLGNDKALLTFQVNLTFNKTEKEIEKEKAELIKGRPVEKDEEGKEKETVVNEEEIIKSVTDKKYVAVQVYYLKDEDRYIVHELPSFTSFDETPNKTKTLPEFKGLKSVTGSDASEIKVFLETFFESFANDPSEKLSYLIEDPKHQHGLSESMQFVEIKHLDVYEGKEENESILNVTVGYSEPETEIVFYSQYLLVVQKQEKDERYIVKSINDKKYIDELINKKKEDSEGDKSVDKNNEGDEENEDQ